MGGGFLTFVLLSIIDLTKLKRILPVRTIALTWALALIFNFVPFDCRQEIAVSCICPGYFRSRSLILKFILFTAAIVSRSRTAIAICAIASPLPVKVIGTVVVFWESWMRVHQNYGFLTFRLQQILWGLNYWIVNGVIGLNQAITNPLHTIKLHSIWIDLLLAAGPIAPLLFGAIAFSKSKTLAWYCWIIMISLWSCNWWWICWFAIL